jgi:hypothetical protein
MTASLPMFGRIVVVFGWRLRSMIGQDGETTMRLASALCLAGALCLLIAPLLAFTVPAQTSGTSGYELWTLVWRKRITEQNAGSTLVDLLLRFYPAFLFVGLVASSIRLRPRLRAILVGGSAMAASAALCALWLEVVVHQPRFETLTVWFYLSLALWLVCLILSAVEIKRSPPAN